MKNFNCIPFGGVMNWGMDETDYENDTNTLLIERWVSFNTGNTVKATISPEAFPRQSSSASQFPECFDMASSNQASTYYHDRSYTTMSTELNFEGVNAEIEQTRTDFERGCEASVFQDPESELEMDPCTFRQDSITFLNEPRLGQCLISSTELVVTGEEQSPCKSIAFAFNPTRSENGECIEFRPSEYDEKWFKCKKCVKTFTNKSNLMRHLLIHSVEKPNKCLQGPKSFNRKVLLEESKLLHSSEKLFKCEICEKSYSRRYSLKEHMRVHSGEKPYNCEKCQKSFSRRNYLNAHKFGHFKEKLYKCNVCSKIFTRGQSLLRHIKSHNHQE